MTTRKVQKTPKISKKSGAKARKVGAGKRGGVKHVEGLHRQEKRKASSGGGHGTVELPKGTEVREYPSEGKNRTPFGKDVRVVGHGG